MSARLAVDQGKSFPLGATLVPSGGNFSVISKHSTGARLLLFDDVDAQGPSRVIDLDPRTNRTYHYWHVFVPGITAGQPYAYRVAGPFDPERGLRFDPDYTGCGNTLNANEPILRRLILDSLRIGSARCMSTAFALTSPRFCRATSKAVRCHRRQSSGT